MTNKLKVFYVTILFFTGLFFNDLFALSGPEYNEKIIGLIASAKEAFVLGKDVKPLGGDLYLFECHLDGKNYKVFGINKYLQQQNNYEILRDVIFKNLELEANIKPNFMQVVGDSACFCEAGSIDARFHIKSQLEKFDGVLLYGYTGHNDGYSLDVNGLVNEYVDAYPDFAPRVLANVVDFHSRAALGELKKPVPTLEGVSGWGTSVSEYVTNFFLVWELDLEILSGKVVHGAGFGDDTISSDSLTNHSLLLYSGGIQSFEQAVNVLKQGVPVRGFSGLRGSGTWVGKKEYKFFEAADFLSFITLAKKQVTQKMVAAGLEADFFTDIKNKYVFESSNLKEFDGKKALLFNPARFDAETKLRLWARGWNNFLDSQVYNNLPTLYSCITLADSRKRGF